jgi:hypothetical protein
MTLVPKEVISVGGIELRLVHIVYHVRNKSHFVAQGKHPKHRWFKYDDMRKRGELVWGTGGLLGAVHGNVRVAWERTRSSAGQPRERHKVGHSRGHVDGLSERGKLRVADFALTQPLFSCPENISPSTWFHYILSTVEATSVSRTTSVLREAGIGANEHVFITRVFSLGSLPNQPTLSL